MIRKRFAAVGLAALGLMAAALLKSGSVSDQRIHALREFIPVQLNVQTSASPSTSTQPIVVEEDVWTEDRQRSLLAPLPRNCSVFIKQLREYATWRVEALRKLVATGGDIRAPGAEGLKVVVVSSTGGGFGDRLPFMISVLAFCMRYKRVFFIDWPPFAKFVYSPFLDWRLREDLYPKLVARIRNSKPKLLYTCENDGEDTQSSCIWAHTNPDVSLGGDLLHLAGNRGMWSSGSNRPHMDWYFNSIIDRVPACAHQALVQPRPVLLARAQPMLDRFASLRAQYPYKNLTIVGFHYRAGDAVLLRNGAGVRAGAGAGAASGSGAGNGAGAGATAAAGSSAGPSPLPPAAAFTVEDMSAGWRDQLKLCATQPHYAVFLLSDSAGLRADAVRRFGADRIITTDVTPRHVGDVELRNTKGVDETEAVADVLTDWWLLKHADFIVVGKMDSGFSRMAVLASSHARILYSQVMIGQSVGHCRANDVSVAGSCPHKRAVSYFSTCV